MEFLDFVVEENMFGQSFGEGLNVVEVSMENNGSLLKDGKGFEYLFDYYQGVDLLLDYNFSIFFDLGIDFFVLLGFFIELFDEDFIWYFGVQKKQKLYVL